MERLEHICKVGHISNIMKREQADEKALFALQCVFGEQPSSGMFQTLF